MKTFSELRIGGFKGGHCQGIAIDKNREFIYFSFTTELIKADLDGNIIGSVTGIVGHLGCLAYNEADGRVYGSLEYKNDSIGKGILDRIGKNITFSDSFYIVSFDVQKINKMNMDANKDGIMKAVYLKEAREDYSAKGNRYGCSGIDGITFAPIAGTNGEKHIFVSYGIYSDTKRKDNDHQILLCYSFEDIKKYEKPLEQFSMHTSGPEYPLHKYFIYTGNTAYGIQNLEYDKENNCLFAAVYKGKKLRFPNYSLFAIDINVPSQIRKLKGLNEYGSVLPLKKFPFFKCRGKICGSNFPYGSTGMISLGNGNFLFSEDFNDKNGYGTVIFSYKFNVETGFSKEEILL